MYSGTVFDICRQCLARQHQVWQRFPPDNIENYLKAQQKKEYMFYRERGVPHLYVASLDLLHEWTCMFFFPVMPYPRNQEKLNNLGYIFPGWCA